MSLACHFKLTESVMSTIARTTRTSFALAGLASAVRAVAGGIAKLFVASRNRREVASLMNADPAMLRDLGLTTLDLDSALSEPFWRDPSARLVTWTNERRAAARAAARDNLAGLAPSRVTNCKTRETC